MRDRTQIHAFLESAGQGLYEFRRGQEKNENLMKIQVHQELHTDLHQIQTITVPMIFRKHLDRVF